MTRHHSGYSPFKGRHQDPPLPELAEVCWRVIGPSGKPIVFGIYRNAAGLEVRCHYAESVDALVRSERASEIRIARDIAAAWRQAALDKGFCELTGGRE
jgi:hypothetical protein